MAEAQATDFLRHAATSRIKSHHRSFFTSADIGHIIDLKSGRASTTVARQRRGAGGAKKKTAASSLLQELAVPIEFSEKVLKTMDVDASIDGKPVLVRMQPLHDSEGPRKVPVIAVEDVPAVIEQQLEVLGTVGPANLFYHMRHHMPFALAPGPDGKPRVIRGACGFTEESIVLYMAGDPYYVDTKQHRGKAKARDYQVGDAVLLTLPNCGTVGGFPVQMPKKPVGRVVGVRKPFGKRAYLVRTNHGVLSKAVEPRQLQPAPPRSAATLRFDGVETQGVPKISVHAARGKAALRCHCRGPKCGPNCACKKAQAACTRWCTCKHGKGGNCS